MWKNLRGWVILAAILGGGYLLLHFVLFRPAPIAVRVHVVARGIVERTVNNTRAGSVKARLAAEIVPDTQGRVIEIVKREGARVSQGDPLLRLDDRTAEAAIALARRDVEAAVALRNQSKVSADEAVREFKRLDGLRAEGAVSKAEWDRAQSQVDLTDAAFKAAEARVEEQRAMLAQAELEKEKLTVKAPFGGVVAKVYVELGEWASPGKPAVKLIDLDQLYIRAELDEVDIGRVHEGLDVRVTLDPYKGRTFLGRVQRVAHHVSELQAENRTVEIDVELTSGVDGEKFKPGTSADVEVILETTKGDTLRLPTLAVMEGGKVLVVKDGTAREAKIESGLRNWDWTEVKTGLAEGDHVVVSLDRKEVKAGAWVTIEKEDDR